MTHHATNAICSQSLLTIILKRRFISWISSCVPETQQATVHFFSRPPTHTFYLRIPHTHTRTPTSTHTSTRTHTRTHTALTCASTRFLL